MTKASAKSVLTPTIEIKETPVITDAPLVKKPYKKRYHKKPKATILAVPVAEISLTVEKEVLTPIKPKLNWFQRQWNKFVAWYNA